MPFLKTLPLLGFFCAVSAAALDLHTAVIVVPAGAPSPEQKAAIMLTEEVAKRTQIRLKIASQASGSPAIFLGVAVELGAAAAGLPAVSAGADGYRVKVTSDGVVIAGNDARGTFFGAGFLLRRLRMERQILNVDDGLEISTAPKYPLRGHQLGYRPKMNAYDGWTPRHVRAVHPRLSPSSAPMPSS